MPEYTFDGKWQNGIIRLPVFEQLDRFSILRDGSSGIPLEYYDLRSLSPDPLPEQLAAVNWLMQEENQKRVLAVLLLYFHDVVYPRFKAYVLPEEYPDAYPPLNKVADLRNLISFGLITIQPSGRNGRTSINYYFSTPLDYEHGVSVEMLDDLVVGWEKAPRRKTILPIPLITQTTGLPSFLPGKSRRS